MEDLPPAAPAVGHLAYYGADGEPCDDPDKAVAMRKNGRCFVRERRYGPDAHALVDPRGFPDLALGKFDRATSGPLYPFRRVSDRSLGLYLMYLKTGQPGYLRNAEREADLF